MISKCGNYMQTVIRLFFSKFESYKPVCVHGAHMRRKQEHADKDVNSNNSL